MSLWFTSDHHFGHLNIIQYCNRPFLSVEQMNEKMIEKWNQKIDSNDIVYVVGDFCLCDQDSGSKICSRLNGQKILIKGNHDKSAEKMFQFGFVDVRNSLSVTLSNGSTVLLRHKPLEKIDAAKFSAQIHGHVHSGPQILERKINVCVDLWDFEPVSEFKILELLNSSSV